jgi:hypothetical protein
MKSASLAGIVLIVLGALVLAYHGINYTRHEKILNLGPIHATEDEPRHFDIPPMLGGLALIGGVALLVLGAKQKA